MAGRLTIVQESRFRGATDDGRSFLFTLAHSANSGADDRFALRDAGEHLAVKDAGVQGNASR